MSMPPSEFNRDQISTSTRFFNLARSSWIFRTTKSAFDFFNRIHLHEHRRSLHLMDAWCTIQHPKERLHPSSTYAPQLCALNLLAPHPLDMLLHLPPQGGRALIPVQFVAKSFFRARHFHPRRLLSNTNPRNHWLHLLGVNDPKNPLKQPPSPAVEARSFELLDLFDLSLFEPDARKGDSRAQRAERNRCE